MNPFVVFYNFVIRAASPLLVFVAKRLRSTFYLYLAAVFSVLIAVDAAFLHIIAGMQHGAFDVMMRYRVMVPKPDPAIVIVDIDEKSLAALSLEYGRWPWPRQVLGEFLEHLARQRPQAVVFDILFSDADVYNPDSDAYFDAAVARTDNAWFPFLRLDPASDPLSRIRPAMIPGVTPGPGEPREDATVAVVLPHFPSILKSGRLGLHNIYPDADGIAREYLVYREDYGWRIPSLPARVVRDLGTSVPDVPRVLLNWRGPPFTYPTASFGDVFHDMLSKQRRRPADEFAGKIVLVGSTAPSLFDVKPTPMATLHPGVEILATALDNLRRGDYLRFPDGRYVYPLVAALVVWLVALAIFRDPAGRRIDHVVGSFELALLAVSYASINLSHTYINLTGPFTVVLAYYGFARFYAAATGKVLRTGALRRSLESTGELGALLLLVRAPAPGPFTGRGRLRRLRRGLMKLGRLEKSVEILDGRQQGIWSVFNQTLVVSWVFPAHDAAERERVLRDLETLTASLDAHLRREGGAPDNGSSWYAHEGRITGGEAASAGWTALFAEAQLRWQRGTT